MSSTGQVHILGGHQTDFARRASREGVGVFELMKEAIEGALEDAALEPEALEVFHVGNFTGELFVRQGQLGGLVAAMHPSFSGRPTSRHEAACASGSIAVLAAMADLECGRYDVACVVGVEEMRNVPGQVAAEHLGVAAWAGREAQGAAYVWPHMFGRITEAYAERAPLDPRHLLRIAEINFENARRNPKAQARAWTFPERAFELDDAANPRVEGCIRRQDCAQITDGAAAIILASSSRAASHARRRGFASDAPAPHILGFGHRTAPMLLEDKLAQSRGTPLMFPHLRGTMLDALRRAELPGIEAVDALEVHDCFTISEYLAIEHLGLTPPGQGFRAIEDGTIARGGRRPVNPSGGLIGGGHPIGATGVRQVLDAAKQVSGRAGDCQVEGAKIVGTLNLGGSMTTTVSFLVGA